VPKVLMGRTWWLATCAEVEPDIEQEKNINEELYKKCGRQWVNVHVEEDSEGHQPHYIIEVEYK
jgi:hypothetical protein